MQLDWIVGAVTAGMKLLITLYAVYAIADTIYKERNNYSFIWKIWKTFTVKMFIESIFIFILLATAFSYLKRIPFLNWGWANLFFAGGGNIAAAPLEGANSGNDVVSTLAICFLFMLILALPFLASYEEKYFRGGCYRWKAMTKQSIKFGLIHLFMGIPIAAGLAIIIPGFFYAYQYRKSFINNAKELLGMQNAGTDQILSTIERMEKDGRPEIMSAANEAALLKTTSYHTLFNTMLLGTMFILLILSKILHLLTSDIQIVVK